MSRRLLTAGLSLAALLGASAWAGLAPAKTPDLPVAEKDVPTPPAPPDGADSPPNAFPPAAAPAAPPLFFRMRPSARRVLASCALFGVHPLLALAPTEEYVDFDEDDAPPAPTVFFEPSEHVKAAPTGSLIGGVAVNSDAGLTGSIETNSPALGAVGCGGLLKGCLHLVPRAAVESDSQTAERCEGCAGSRPEASESCEGAGGAAAPLNDSAEYLCPYMNQQRCAPDRHAVLFADQDLSQDVLKNLEALREARNLLDQAEELGKAGHALDALELLNLACDVCPGRFDGAVQQEAAEILAPFYCGSPTAGDVGAEEPSDSAPETGCVLRLCSARSEQECEIEQKLAFPVSVSFHDTPLREVIDDLRSWQDLNIYVDEAALEEAGISLDRSVTVRLNNVALKSALKLILQDAGLTYVVKDDVLQITTQHAARGKLTQVVYEVADLLQGDLPGTPGGAGHASPEELIKLVTHTVSPAEWSDKGGDGTIDFHPRSRSLVVNQTADVQEQVADLLETLRRYKQGDEEIEETRRCGPGCCDECDHGCPASVEARAAALMRACHAAMQTGRRQEAAAFAEKAYALDPQGVAADPLVYKLHLTGDGAAPPRLTPSLPPVDSGTPAALDQLYPESPQSAPAGGTEEKDPPAPKDTSSAPQGSFEFGLGLDGSVQMFGQLHRGGAIWHLVYGDSGLSVWSAPDGGADQAPAPMTTPDDDSGD